MVSCQQCGAEWPSEVKFCGKCGTRIEANASALSGGQSVVNEQLKQLLPQIGLGAFNELRPGIHIARKGSTHVEVRVVQMIDQILIRSTAPVTVGTPIKQDLLEFLLRENANFLFGAFGIGPRNEIIFTDTINGSSVDRHELGSSVRAVVNMADKYDNEIVRRWGGKTASDSAVESLLGPALLKALLAGANFPVAPIPTTRPTIPIRDTQPQPTLTRPQIDVRQAIKVGSVPEEYLFISRQRCSCGGTYTRDTQGIVTIDGRFYDQLNVSCQGCGDEKNYLFDINSFFAKGLR